MHQDRFKNYLMTGLLVHGVTCALVGEALHLFLDVPAFLLGVLHLPALLRHSPAHLLLARLTLLLVHGAGDFLGNEVTFLLRDIVALLPRNLPAVVLGDVLAELLRDVGADLARHLDVVTDLAGQLLAFNPLAVRADGLSFLALHVSWNVLALGGRDILAHLLGYLVAVLGWNILALLRRDIRADFLLDIRALLLKLRPAVLNWRILANILALLLVMLGGAHLVAALLVLSCALLVGYGLALLLRHV